MGEQIYLLFDTNQFGNSNDLVYELDYAFQGAYRSEKDALEYFANTMVEGNENLMNRFYDENDNLLHNVKNKLKMYGWKLIVTSL
jgi:hypothetical protein